MPITIITSGIKLDLFKSNILIESCFEKFAPKDQILYIYCDSQPEYRAIADQARTIESFHMLKQSKIVGFNQHANSSKPTQKKLCERLQQKNSEILKSPPRPFFRNTNWVEFTFKVSSLKNQDLPASEQQATILKNN